MKYDQIAEAYASMLNESVEHPMIDVDGVLKHRHNSLGQPIHHTDEGIKNFHRWFGNSSTVDEHGRPKVFYHGTSSNIESFSHEFVGRGNDQYGSGFYFTDSPTIANHYTSGDMTDIKQTAAPNVLPVYLSLKKVISHDDQTPLKRDHIKKIITSAPDHMDSLSNFGDVDYEGYNKVLNRAVDAHANLPKFNAMNYLHNDFYSGHTKDFLTNFQKITSHDGVMTGEHGNMIITAFDPAKIKSAVGNTGDFKHKSKITESYDAAASSYVMMLQESKTHPERDERGRTVTIHSPDTPSPTASWNDPEAHALITPAHAALDSDSRFSEAKPDWHDTSLHGTFEEPALNNRSGKHLASGVIIHEDDGRVWVVHPTNQFGGYEATFPKGRVDAGLDMRSNAIKEAWEESGLAVQLTGHAADVERSTSYTRYYHAKRIGGHPKNMGWESQAVSLVPKSQLHKVVNHPNDAVLVAAAKQKV